LDFLCFSIFVVFFIILVKTKSFHSRNPTWVFFFEKREHNGLNPCKIRTVLGVEMDDIKDILPKIVILLNVLVKTTLTSFAIVIKNKFLNAANIAHCGHVDLVI
jgi:hypothetical protein